MMSHCSFLHPDTILLLGGMTVATLILGLTGNCRGEDQNVIAATSHPADASTPNTTQRRGFTLWADPVAFPRTLREAVEKWHINIVRYGMNVRREAEQNGGTYQEALDRLLKVLPEHLAEAKKLGVTLVILADLPNEKMRDSRLQGKERLAAYWDDDANLDLMIECWRRIARVCKDNDQDIWFDLHNEPLDWRDFPSYPKKWPLWAQKITDAIRQIDVRHPIVVETGPGGLCWGMKDFPVLHGAPLIYSIHVYVPHAYTHQGLADIRKTDLAKTYLQRQRPWPGQFEDGDINGYWDRATLERALQPAIDFQKRHPDIRIFVGEFSAIRWAPHASDYLRDCMEIFEKHGWDWIYHGFHDDPVWSLEHTDDYADSAHAVRATELTDRAKVVLEYLARNQRDPAR
ncbi:MAG: glycoside hydrolase family 5 protein [Phycisphaerales bacterium]